MSGGASKKKKTTKSIAQNQDINDVTMSIDDMPSSVHQSLTSLQTASVVSQKSLKGKGKKPTAVATGGLKSQTTRKFVKVTDKRISKEKPMVQDSENESSYSQMHSSL